MPDFSNDLLQMLRLQNAFAPEQMVGGNPPLPAPTMNTQIFQPPTAAPEVDPVSRFLQMYQPEDTYMNQAAGMLGQIPERPKPELWRKILGSVVAGLTQSIPAGRDVIERPYREKLADWEVKYKPTADIARMEQTRNTMERQAAYNAAQAESSTRRAETAAAEQRRREEQGQARIELDRKKFDLLKLKYDNPELVFEESKDGYIYGLHPRTGQSVNTGIKGTDLDPLEKLRLMHGYRMKEIAATSAGDIKEIEAREKGAEKRIEVGKWAVVDITENGKTRSVRLNTVTGETKEIGGKVSKPEVTGATERAKISAGGKGPEGEKAESANQRKIAEYLRAREALNLHPEWRRYITLGDPATNDFKIKKPTFGSDSVKKQIDEYVYGKGKAAAPTAATGPKVGDTKTFPNGKRGRWDGKGWVLIK